VKNKSVAALLVLKLTLAFGFETDLLNLKVPSSIKPGTIMLDIEHRLLGGLTGANVDFGLRGMVWSGIELNAAYAHYTYDPRDRTQNEYRLGASYVYRVPHVLRVQGDAQFFSYQVENAAARRQSVFGLLSLAGEPILKHVTPVVNIGYDGYERRLELGAGLDLGFPFNVGPFRLVHLTGEYCPVIARDTLRNGRQNSFAGGVTFETYGHHFQFLVGNSLETGVRRLMLGAPKNNLYLGFNIHRFLDLTSF
jgi:hypothetical protein